MGPFPCSSLSPLCWRFLVLPEAFSSTLSSLAALRLDSYFAMRFGFSHFAAWCSAIPTPRDVNSASALGSNWDRTCNNEQARSPGLVLKLGRNGSTVQVLIKEDSIATIRCLPLSPFFGVSPGMMTSRIFSPQVEYPRMSRFLMYEAGRKLHATSKVAPRKLIESKWRCFGGFCDGKIKRTEEI
jgi:hypothetical protein